MRGLEGRTYVVTGAASGIGLATAQRLVEAGARVVVLDLEQARVDAATADLGDAALGLACDVSDEAAVASAVRQGVERYGGLDGAVTSASVFDEADLVNLDVLDLAVFDRVVSINLRGTVLVLRAVLPHLGAGSAIVTVASTAGLRGHGFGPSYTATKGAVVALTRLLAVQYGPAGVRVNCVCPGATAGDGMGAIFQDPAVAAGAGQGLPLARVGQAEELGATIAALLSDECSYVTGQVLAVDGGATVR